MSRFIDELVTALAIAAAEIASARANAVPTFGASMAVIAAVRLRR
jgi:hypothetical protein